MATPEQFVEVARTFLNTPYHHQQCSRYGVDCIGLILAVGLELGYDWRKFDIPDRPGRPDGQSFVRQIEAVCGNPVERSPRVGDLLVFKIYKEPQHCGLMTDIGLLHADRQWGKVIETSLGYWEKRLVAVYEIPLRGEV